MKKLGLFVLAGVMALAPLAAAAATNSSAPNSETAGGRLPGPPGQHLYLQTHSDVTLSITPACTKVSADDVPFGNVQPSNLTIQHNLEVSWKCGAGVQPYVSFESFTSHPCAMSNGAQNIPYSIFKAGTSGTNLCNSDNSHPPTTFYATTSPESGNNSHTFNVVTGPLLNGLGQSLYPVGNYSDTVNVYLEF